MTLFQLLCVAMCLLCVAVSARSAYQYFYKGGDGVTAGSAGVCALLFALLSGVRLW